MPQFQIVPILRYGKSIVSYQTDDFGTLLTQILQKSLHGSMNIPIGRYQCLNVFLSIKEPHFL